MSKQDLLNASVAQVVNQGGPSYIATRVEEGVSFGCVYRSDDGRGCGAAPFIVNYKPEMEHKSWSTLIDKFPNDLMPEAIGDNAYFVRDLQAAHDNTTHYTFNKETCELNVKDFFKKYCDRIQKLCNKYSLTIPVELVLCAVYDSKE